MANRRDPEMWHKGKVVYGRFIPDNIRFWELELKEHEQKIIEVCVRAEKPEKSTSQLAFYFGVVIKKYCMQSEQFGGWTEMEIDQHFRWELTRYTKQLGPDKHGFYTTKTLVDEIHSYTKEQMAMFLDKVIGYLAMEGIQVDDTIQYKWNKYKG